MTGQIVYAEGSPCPTLVVDRRRFGSSDADVLGGLTTLRRTLHEQGDGHILKNALIRPSKHPLFDLDYLFVQSLPAGLDQYDLRGSCGHSILSAVLAAAKHGMIQPLLAGTRIRVNVLNNGDNVVCEVESVNDTAATFTAHFLCAPARPLAELLMLDEPITELTVGDRTLRTSMVSMGNPYVFVNAADLGVTTAEELFADDSARYAQLVAIREAACARMGWDSAGAFPKIAALLPLGPGRVAARAISVPSWHPTLALTGAICLGAAMEIAGSLPNQLVTQVDGMVRIDTAGGSVQVLANTRGFEDPYLEWVSVGGKTVTYLSRIDLSQFTSEESSWLPVPA